MKHLLLAASASLLAAGPVSAQEDQPRRTEIVIENGAVWIDGERQEDGRGPIIIIDGEMLSPGAEARVRIARRAAELARADAGAARALARVEVMDPGFAPRLRAEIRETLDRALADVERERGGRRVYVHRMSEEEREVLRSELGAMRERIREMTAEAAGFDREALRDSLRQLREELAGMRESGMERSLRVEEHDGRRRVWLDGRELEGEELTEWLNRMERHRLAGEPGDARVIIRRSRRAAAPEAE
ncbi:MAG: hypothetical protein KIS81_06845 [Maricaulaceae bacterium]|nr:hypothetical protein [Maricaulaceae bacterium]